MSKLRKSARGQQCTLRLTGCNYNLETVVLAHIRINRFCGVGIKPPDYMGCFACSSCHDTIDGRVKSDTVYKDVLRAHFETLQIWVDSGLIGVRD
ncbi:nuclease domain-containing protein [Psychrobacter namhaensis]|uniref:nuclease domain-containing protein n=1 Tax=Psychrobacter namhaensis TaxID=292734 RepID=UPI0018DF4693|nr:nuclease domain-containing protein [Psychrobacter namhaensis]